MTATFVDRLRRFLPDPYIAALFGMVALASLLPVHGRGAVVFGHVTDLVIALLFFLYGSRLAPRDVLDGMRDLRLHALVLAFTYLVFPVLGLGTRLLVPWLLSPQLQVGVVYLCVLPSTVQSSIAFTSMARGNVAAALCSASLSNLLGVLITPLLVGALLSHQGGQLTSNALRDIALQLLLPFALGQLLRPLTQRFIVRHKLLLGLVDRASILLVVYGAFSEAVVSGIWHRLGVGPLLTLLALSALLLLLVLLLTTGLSRQLGLRTEDEIVLVFCGSKKSMASGLPMASVLFGPALIGAVVLPLMIFHQLQLVVCAWLARRYAERPQPAAL